MTQTNKLKRWLAEEPASAQAMTCGAGAGVMPIDQVTGKSGLEVMRGMQSGTLPYAAITQTMDFVLVTVESGHAVFQGTPLARHLNPLSTIHRN